MRELEVEDMVFIFYYYHYFANDGGYGIYSLRLNVA